jgi:glycosyltransferase involved in cell wall biosynthesis
MRKLKISLIVVALKFAWIISDVTDGLTHRYYGLYANLCKLLLEKDGNIFWYEASNRTLLKLLNDHFRARKITMFGGLVNSVKESLSHGALPVVLLDYPHSFTGIKNLPDYLFSLIFLHALRLLNRVFVVVDNMDPPIEHAEELEGRCGLTKRALWSLLNKLVLSFDLILFHTNSYKTYHALYYRIKPEKMLTVPPGSFPELIPYRETPRVPPLRILYSGIITRWNNAYRLIEIIQRLADIGLDVELIVTGKDQVGVKSDRAKIMRTVQFQVYTELLSQAHIFVIPYPKTLHHMLTMRAKLADYMMAGRAVLFTASLGMNEVIAQAGCGFTFESMQDLEDLLIRMYKDEELIKSLGRKARSFAEKHMVYSDHAKKLLREIMSRLSLRWR